MVVQKLWGVARQREKKSCRTCHWPRIRRSSSQDEPAVLDVEAKEVAAINQYAPLAQEDGLCHQIDIGDAPMETYQATKVDLQTCLQEAKQQHDDHLTKAFEERLNNLKEPTFFLFQKYQGPHISDP